MQKHFAVSVFTDTCNKGVQCHVRLFPTIETATQYFDEEVVKMEGWIKESIEETNLIEVEDLLTTLQEIEDCEYDKTTGHFSYNDNDGTIYLVKITDMTAEDTIDIIS